MGKFHPTFISPSLSTDYLRVSSSTTFHFPPRCCCRCHRFLHLSSHGFSQGLPIPCLHFSPFLSDSSIWNLPRQCYLLNTCNRALMTNPQNPPPIVSCPEPSRKRPKSLGDDEDETMLCKRVVTKDRRYITQITCYEKGQNGKANLGKPISRTPMRMPLFGKQGGGVLSNLFSKIGRQGEVSDCRDPISSGISNNDWNDLINVRVVGLHHPPSFVNPSIFETFSNPKKIPSII